MARSSVYPRTLLCLAAVATMLPIFSGYFVGFLLLLWLLSGQRYRELDFAPKSWTNAHPNHDSWSQAYAAIVRPIHWGVLGLITSQIVSSLGALFTSTYAQSWSEACKVSLHMSVKWGLLWFVFAGAMGVARRRGLRLSSIAPWFAVWMVVQVMYAIAQRYTGIDWTHGFDAVLGSHRYAYGVYRVSGFMGHPLTLAYNLMLVIFASFAMAVTLGRGALPGERRAWLLVMTAAAVILLISVSRFVLFVVPAVLVLLEGRRLRRHWPLIAAIGAALAALIWWEGSIIGRFVEIFDQKGSLTDRFPRLVFWQVHWRMFMDHPVFGVSIAGLDEAREVYYSAIGYRDKMYTAHNIFLQAAADSGLIGVAGILSLLGGLTVAGFRARQLLGHGAGLGALALATALSGLLQNNLRDSEYLYTLWFVVGLLAIRAADLVSAGTPLRPDERKSPQNFQSTANRSDPT